MDGEDNRKWLGSQLLLKQDTKKLLDEIMQQVFEVNCKMGVMVEQLKTAQGMVHALYSGGKYDNSDGSAY